MDTKLERYHLENAATDAFRRICLTEVDIGEGLTTTLAQILEDEARARCENLLRGHIEHAKVQDDIEDRIKRDVLLLKSNEKPEELII